MGVTLLSLEGALARSVIFRHVLEEQLPALRSLLLIPIVLLAWMSPARADTFENFVIQNSSNLSAPGGTFYGGGTYSGSFSLDESLDPGESRRQVCPANLQHQFHDTF